MFRKRTLWGVVLLVVTLLLLADRAEAVVFGIKPPQNFCSSKLALQIGKWTLSSNDLGYLMKHAVLSNSVEWKRKTTCASIPQGLDMTEAAHVAELLSGLAGAYFIGYWGGLFVSGMIKYRLLPRFGLEPESETSRTLGYYFGFCPMVALGAAIGTSFTGLCLNQKGSFIGALIGSTLGVATGIAFCRFLDNGDFRLGLLYYSCPSIGAVLGYNYVLGRPGAKPWRQ